MESIFTVLHMVIAIINFAKANNTVCSLSGGVAYPHFWKNGDIVVGGIFPFHSSWEFTDLSYSIMPPPIKCTR